MAVFKQSTDFFLKKIKNLEDKIKKLSSNVDFLERNNANLTELYDILKLRLKHQDYTLRGAETNGGFSCFQKSVEELQETGYILVGTTRRNTQVWLKKVPGVSFLETSVDFDLPENDASEDDEEEDYE